MPARRGPRCRRLGAAGAVGAGQLPPSEPPASAAAFAPGGGPARREPDPLPASERAAQSALLAAVAAEAAAARLACLPPSARPAEATWAGAAGNFEKLSRSQACGTFEGKPRPRPTPSPIRACEISEGSQLLFQTVPAQRLGETVWGRAADTLGSAQVWGGPERDADGLGLPPSWSRCPGRSAGIAPVGGLRAALWVARDEPGRDRLIAIALPQNLAFWGSSGNRCYFPP